MILRSARLGPLPRLVAVIMMALALALVARVEHSVAQTVAQDDQQVAQVQHFNISGVVESVSYASNTVHINASGQTVDVVITPTTVIEYHGETGSVGNIRRGSKITASGVVHGGQKVALSITIK